MKTLRLISILSLAIVGLTKNSAQTPITPAEQEKLLEAARQKVAQERGITPPIQEPAPVRAMKPVMTPPSIAMGTGPTLMSAEYDQLLVILRSKVAEERAKTSAVAEPVSSGKSLAPTPPSPSPAPSAPTQVAAKEPAPNSDGPKTKQERLEGLLLLYQGDFITPNAYHEQRAKILAEP